jgi:hypothetical protein
VSMTQQDPNSFLMSSGAKSFKFEKHGDTAKGTILSLDMQQQRDIKDNSLKWWDEAKTQAMMQLRVVLQTDMHDDDNDDGQRSLYVKGEMQKAVREAIKTAGATMIEEGGTLAVQYSGDGTASKAGFNPPKQYRAQYSPPVKTTSAVSADDLL